ncbi:MAG: hypothetical protein LQ344_007563 [Seirophora lacunosa]|nr:MAG: hypothetical protein LQ344_007563 [Seirophora lacunosa]
MPTQITSSSAFFTNLRLLDLDYLEDWPDVTADIFAPKDARTKDARTNQKQRIRCVEWALYRLFEIWNPKETRNKLQPFFPPYDPLRSINLRAALFRCLNELKKDGILAKDIIIRKTMFDECKGERFEDLLASFSTIVLQKVLRRQPHANKSIGGRLATCNNVSASPQSSLLPLAIAHQGALRALLQRKDELKQRYGNFQKVLKAKEQQLLQEVDRLAQADVDCPLNAVSDRTVQEMREQFDRHWQDNTGWINGIVEADRRDFGDPLLDSPFSTVWSHVEAGTTSAIGTEGQRSLLQDLNSRIHTQQMRLRRWQNIHRGMVESRPRSPVKVKENSTPNRTRGLQSPLKFVCLDQNGADSPRKSAGISPEVKMQYHRLLECSRGIGKATQFITIDTPSKKLTVDVAVESASPDEAEIFAHPSKLDLKLPTTSQRHGNVVTVEASQSVDSFDEAEKNERKEAEQRAPLDAALTNRKKPLDEAIAEMETSLAAGPDQVSQVKRSKSDADHGSPHASTEGHTPPSAADEIIHDEDALAQQIISSAMNADPSPTKCKISLTERTRQSIAFARPESFLPDALEGSTLVRSTKKAESNTIPCTSLERSSSLLERTRRSISLVPAPKGSRESMHGRRQSKQYPRNPFETPKKRLDVLQEMTPPEVLFSPQADYASVFKSRPKIATSPNVSPTLAGDGGAEED